MLKSEYHFSGLIPFTLSSDGIFLGLLKIDRIPPHLILCIGEKYFSLEKGKCIVNGDLPLVIAKLNRKRISCLFVRLPDISKGTAIHLANGFYLRYTGVDTGITCLDPLKHFAAKAFGWNTLGAEVVFDILDQAFRNGMRHGHGQLNAASSEVSLARYTREEVAQHIQALG